MGIFKTLLGGKPRWENESHDLYETVVAQARQEAFYLRGRVADSIDGRFDLVVLHAFLLFRRLGRIGGEALDLSQKTFDLMFADFDGCLREMGVSDMGMAPKIKKMAKAFFGRIQAYDGTLDTPDALSDALARNLYRGKMDDPAVLRAMVAYVRAQAALLDAQEDAALMQGRLRFSAPEL